MFENMNIFTTDEIFAQAVCKVFEQFCKFMNVPVTSMPKVDINIAKIDTSQNMSVAYTVLPKSYNDKATISLCKEMFILKKEKMIPLLFHEFAHIYDYWNTIAHRITPQSKLGSYAYDEFHATIIEIMAGCKLSKYAENNTIPLEIAFSNSVYEGTLLGYFSRECEIEKQLHIKYNSHDKCNNIIHQLFYYIGKNYFYEKYCESSNDINFEYENFHTMLGDNVYKLKNILFNYGTILVNTDYFTMLYDAYIPIEKYIADKM